MENNFESDFDLKGLCEPCAIGTFSDGAGVCKPCPSGATTKDTGSTAASMCSCLPGHVGIEGGGGACTVADVMIVTNAAQSILNGRYVLSAITDDGNSVFSHESSGLVMQRVNGRRSGRGKMT